MGKIKRAMAIGVITTILGTTASCSLWDAINPMSKGLSVDTELTVGDKNQTVNADVAAVKNTTTNTADTISITKVDNTSKFMVILALLGWVLPTPSSMWSSFMKYIRRRKNEK